MSIRIAIVTGASRGLGLALTKLLLARGEHVLTLSRGTPLLPATAGHLHWSVDLAEPAAVAARLEAWLRTQSSAAPASACLVNNAGAVSELAPLDAVDAADLANAIRVGLEAPLLLTSVFLRATRDWSVPRKVMLVSSGLGRRGMAGSASYCAAKAGLDNLARAIALEQQALPNGARIVSLAPGVIDTDMQAQLRSADPAQFSERQRFVDLKTSGQLDAPDEAAAKLVAYLDRADYGANPVADVRDR